MPAIVPGALTSAWLVSVGESSSGVSASANQLGEAEIEHLDRAVGADDHVGRLEVAVDDAARVRGGERVRDRNRNPQRLVEAHPLARNERIEALAADVLHHDEVVAVGRLDLVDRDDVRVVEGGGRLRLLDKAATAVRVGHPVSGQHLDGHFTAQARVAGPIHLAHAPRADEGEDFVRAKARTRLQGHVAAAHYDVPCTDCQVICACPGLRSPGFVREAGVSARFASCSCSISASRVA